MATDMDIRFQDRIDDYLLNRMDDADKKVFLQEVKQDEKKKEQLEFTKNVKDSICSREEKLQALAQFQRRYEDERKPAALRPTGTESATCYQTAPVAPNGMPVQSKKRTWLWISGIAAVLLVGFFAIKPMFMDESSPDSDNMPMEQIRGGDDVFDSLAPADSTDNDTITFNVDNKVVPDE